MLVELVIFLGALIGGLVSGLTGFGTGLTVLAFWLLVIPPIVASPLVIICSLIAQLQTFPQIWNSIKWRKTYPYLLGGVAGVPFGYVLLLNISVDQFKLGFGFLLVFYCTFSVLWPASWKFTGNGGWFNPLVGLAGGVLGGLAGLSGVPPSIWAMLHKWSKDEMRAIFQTFNLSILFVALLTQLFRQNIGATVVYLAVIAMPGTILGAWLGRRIYNRLDDQNYRMIILALLMFSGITLVVTQLV